MSDAFLSALQAYLPSEQLHTDPARCWVYGYDNSREHSPPLAVAFVTNTEQIQAIVKLCYQYRVPLTTRGRGTGTAGAAVPAANGIVLSTERMQQIIQIDPDNRLMIAEAGVTNAAIQQSAAKYGFFWAPDPSSSAFCTLGGNLAANSAGPRAIKYGTCRENTLGLTVVTGDGTLLSTGTRTTKGNVGYDLTRLIIGSEGTLAIISQATLKLTPLPAATGSLRLCYQDTVSAANAVTRIMAGTITPCKLEFLDGRSLAMIQDFSPLALPAGTQAMLLIEVDGTRIAINDMLTTVAERAHNAGLIDVQHSDNIDHTQLWQARKALSPALRHIAPKKINEDVVVPISQLATLITRLDAMSDIYGFPIVNFGHAGNGNIHVNLLINPDHAVQVQNAQLALDALFNLVLELGGTLSGEHGIGLVKREFVARELSAPALSLMHKIKQQFDPAEILNPGKGF